MADLPPQVSRAATPERLALVLAAALVYLAVPIMDDPVRLPPAHFADLARAFLEGKLSIEAPPGAGWGELNELIPADAPPASGLPVEGPWRFYCAYPPLPAVLLMPLVAILGAAVKVQTACRIFSVLNVLLFSACLPRLAGRLGHPPLGTSARVALNLLFAFGTVAWHNAEFAGDWHLAHAVALAAMLLALREFLAGNRSLVIGCFLGLALLTRPTAAMTGLFFVMPLLRRRAAAELLRLAAGPALAVFLLALYNLARFDNPADFGYQRMLLRGEGLALMQQYGQFHSHFIFKNAFWFFLAPPGPLTGGRLPFIGYDPRGLSLFAATPALLYVFLAFWRRWECPCVRDAAVGLAACLIPLLLYFNTGFVQFGHRFSMDYLPLLMILVVAGMGRRPGKRAYALMTASIVIQIAGVLYEPMTKLPPWLTPSS
jgi:hypothetical protein